jgi:Protein of unknown function (DUF3037)
VSSRFQYSVVRYMPNVVRDEAVNVGVLIWSVEGHLFRSKFLRRSSAVRKLWPGADQDLVANFQRQISLASSTQQVAFDGMNHPLVERFGNPADSAFLARARREFTGNLQLTEPRGYQASTIEEALEWAYSIYVEEPRSGPRPINAQAIAPFRLRTRLWAAFEQRNLFSPDRVRRQYVVNGRHAPWTFDVAYRNWTLNVVNSLGLDAPTAETNLWRALVFKGMVEDVSNSHKAHGIAVVQLPARHRASAGAQEAKRILTDSSVEVINVNRLTEFADRVAEELA